MIEGSYLFTVDEILRSNRYDASQQARQWLRRLIIPLGIGLIMAGLLLWEKPFSLVSLYLVGLGLYLTFLRKALARYLTRKNFAKRPDQNLEIRFTADDRGITFTTKNSQSSCDWILFLKAVKFRDGVLLYSNRQIYHWIPAHAFSPAEDYQSFSETLRRTMKDFKEDSFTV